MDPQQQQQHSSPSSSSSLLLLEEDSCIYCSKSLYNLNEFNKRMHMNTCKVRKLIESNPFVIQQQQQLLANANQNVTQGNESAVMVQQNNEDMLVVLGESCPFCYRSFKDFKSDFNKQIHIKCCKLKKHVDHQKSPAATAGATSNTSPLKAANDMMIMMANNNNSNNSICLFCQKSLTSLNEFNKKMHIENCKIRKSIEGTLYRRPSKSARRHQQQQTSQQQGGGAAATVMDLNQCLFCPKSFHNLSQFNKKLHLEHCKQKKKKMMTNGSNNRQQQQQSSTQQSNNQHLILNHHQQLPDLSSISAMTMSPMTTSNMILDMGDVCVFCSRSLVNISNFNKKVHIEQCKSKPKSGSNKDQQQQLDLSSNNNKIKYNGEQVVMEKPARKKIKKDDKSGECCDSINPTLGMNHDHQQVGNQGLTASQLNGMLASGNLINLNGVLAASLGVSPNSASQMQHVHQHQQQQHHLNQYDLSGGSHSIVDSPSTVLHHHVGLNGQSHTTLITTTQNGQQIQMPIDLQSSLYG